MMAHLGHRLSEWCGHAPAMEEDRRSPIWASTCWSGTRALSYAARVEAVQRRRQVAYLRDVRQYRNLLLLESRTAISARTMVRQFFYARRDLYGAR